MNKRNITRSLFAPVAIGLLLGGVSARATDYYWIATSPDDYGNPAAWDQGAVPNDPAAVAYTTNDANITYSASDNYQLWQLQLGVSNNTPGGTFTMNGGTLSITNTVQGGLCIGGQFGGSGGNGNGVGSAAEFILNDGTVTVVRNQSTFYQDDVELGAQNDSTGTLTVHGGLLNMICNMQIGYWGHGIFNITGGVVIEDSGLLNVGDGQGANAPTCSGVLNLSGGILYILRNSGHEPASGGGGGLAINRRATNATVNISGGTLYCSQIFTGSGANSTTTPTENWNVSGGDIFVGFAGVNNINNGGGHITEVDISGGTFHTVDMLLQTTTDVTLTSDTNTILADGTNWTWSANLPVNLTNTSFLVNGQSGPGFVTFAPEATRTITLDNVWSGVGGLTVNGPGTVAMSGANTYSGDTTVSQGTLALTGSGSIASPNIIVAGNATFDPSASSFSLGAGQTLTNSGPYAVVNGLNTGSGTVSLVYDGSTPPLMTTSGTLTLDPATVFNINNTGAALPVGSYQVISSSGGTVGGTLPPVSVTGGGIVAGAGAFLSPDGSGGLYLSVVTAPVVSSQIPSTDISLYQSYDVTFSVTAVGGLPLSYQWYTNGVADTAAGTSSSYVLTDVQLAMSGTTFQCSVSNSFGTTASQPVTLTVLPLPSFLASSDYSTNLMALNPTAYWPMHETTPPVPGDVETNYGTLGAVGYGYYADWNQNNGNPGSHSIQHQITGALVNDPDTAASFLNPTEHNSYLLVPHTSPETTLRPPFTIECWVQSDTTSFGDIVSQDGTRLNVGNANNKFGIRLSWGGNIQVYVGNGDAGYSGPAASPSLTLSQWHYAALTCDTNGGTINYTLYVDDSWVSTKTSGFAPDSWDPLTIGAGLWNSGGVTRYTSLAIDEVAIYPTALDATTVSNRYYLGLNGSAGDYFAAVTNSEPLLYYRMNSPTYTAADSSIWPVMTNYGTVAINGTYQPGLAAGSYEGPSSGTGLSADGLAAANSAPMNGLSTFASVTPPDASVFSPPTGTSPFSFSLWFKSNPSDCRYQTLVSQGNGWQLAQQTAGTLQFYLNNGWQNTTGVYNDGNWHHVVVTYAANTGNIYVDGVLDSTKTDSSLISPAPAVYDLGIGCDTRFIAPTYNKGAGRQYAGNICEVAFWNGTELDSSQVQTLYNAAAMPPTIRTQPVSASVDQNTAFTNTVVAVGSAPLAYQWYRNDVPRSGQTSASLELASVQLADAGSWHVVVTNASGMATSSVVTLTVIAAVPTLSLDRVGNDLVITYTGTLLSSTNVVGPYEPVTGASSPYTVPQTAVQQFYRASNP